MAFRYEAQEPTNEAVDLAGSPSPLEDVVRQIGLWPL